ncbi:hypothetical protein ABZ935_40540, partial [Streptomyces coeruleorubidus]
PCTTATHSPRTTPPSLIDPKIIPPVSQRDSATPRRAAAALKICGVAAAGLGGRTPELAELTQRHWQGTAHDGFHMYDGKLPIVVTGMKQLKEHGPAMCWVARATSTRLPPA